MGEKLLCPRCKKANLQWQGDIDSEDLLEKGIMKCMELDCGAEFIGIEGWHKACDEENEKNKLVCCKCGGLGLMRWPIWLDDAKAYCQRCLLNSDLVKSLGD